ncbi:hypothetical protein ACWGBV_19970 [Streptomyces sp. NPDC055051]
MNDGPSSDVDVPADTLLAGYFVAAPERLTFAGLIRTERLTSASDCLTDRFPDGGCWFGTPHEALAACLPLRLPVEARLYALPVPSEHADKFAADVRAAAIDEPVLLAHLDGLSGGQVAEGGRELGPVETGAPPVRAGRHAEGTASAATPYQVLWHRTRRPRRTGPGST